MTTQESHSVKKVLQGLYPGKRNYMEWVATVADCSQSAVRSWVYANHIPELYAYRLARGTELNLSDIRPDLNDVV